MKPYFNVDENIQNRFFFIFGNTNDCFCDNNFIDMDLKYTLNKHLKDCGYKRIVFYGKDEKIHFYDDESFNAKKMQEKTEASPAKKTSKLLSKSPLKSRMAIPSAKHSDKPAATETADVLHFGGMGEVDAFNWIDACMKDKNIKSAVVITNADDFITYFGGVEVNMRNKVLDSFNKYDGLGFTNSNIMIFIFPSQTTASEHNANRAPVWETFFKPKLEKKKITKIHIASPAVGEIRNAINHFRLKYGLQVDFTSIDTISKRIAREFCKDKRPLEWLMAKLKNLVDNRQVLDIERCDEMLGKKDNETAIQKLDRLIGMEAVKKEVRMLENRKKSSEKPTTNEDYHSRILPPISKENVTFNLHYVITGNPGTGKTTAARLLGEIMYESGYLESGHTLEVTRKDLVAGFVGQTAIKTKEKIEEAIGGVLFIDEAYSLVEGGENDFGREAITELVAAMTARKGEFSLVVAGYPEPMKNFIDSNPGLQRRFSKVIHIEDYTPEELIRIFNSNLQKNAMGEKYTLSNDLSAMLNSFFENWYKSRDKNWGNAGNVEKLLESMSGSWWERRGEKSTNGEIILDICDIPADKQQYCKASQETKEDAMIKLKTLTGLARVKERIAKLQRRIQFEGATEPGHYVFSGNPGTGKTTVARLLGDILREEGVLKKGHIVEVLRQDLVAGYVGQTAIQTTKKLEEALDGIFFLDEAYTLNEGSGKEGSFGKEAIDTILAFIENNRKRICAIFAGYTGDMEKFIQTNAGLTSRVSETIIFDDYETDEMVEILHNFAGDFVFTPEYIQKSKQIFDFWLANKDRNFGNARDVRKYFSECKDALYERISREYENSSSVPKEVKKTLTGQDIPLKYSSIVGG